MRELLILGVAAALEGCAPNDLEGQVQALLDLEIPLAVIQAAAIRLLADPGLRRRRVWFRALLEAVPVWERRQRQRH